MVTKKPLKISLYSQNFQNNHDLKLCFPRTLNEIVLIKFFGFKRRIKIETKTWKLLTAKSDVSYIFVNI